MYILSVTSVTPVTPLDLKWHVFLGWFFTIGQDVAYVGSGTLIELSETAVARTILFEAHVLQRFTHLHWRQTYLAAESGDDVGGGEIDGLLVFAGLAVAGGDEFACKVWGLIGAVAGVELRYLFGVEPVAETGVEKMTDLRIYADIVDVGLPRVVDMIDFKDERRHRPWSYAESWSSRRNTGAVRAAAGCS